MVLFGTSRSRASELIAAADAARDQLKWAEAAKLYASALQVERNNPPIWVQLGHALKESGRIESAIGAYTQAIELDPQSSDAHLQLGHARKLNGDVNGAIDCYALALERDPDNKHAKFELATLGATVGIAAPRELARPSQAPRRASSDATATLALDVSDLMHYFLNARSPTGIQRVQINVVASLIDSESNKFQVVLVCFTKQRDFWIEIDPGLFRKICRLALLGADIKDRVWVKAIQDLHSELDVSDSIVFPPNTTLVNLGTSWWLQNYFIMIRHAKARYGIRYMPFVHDCIPVIAPEHCVSNLTQDFIEWIIGVFAHADGYLVNSRATRDDLVRVARFLGHEIPEPSVVPLDGRFPGPFVKDEAQAAEAAWPEFQAKHNLGSQPIVLFVSTVESRKNHLLTFDVWLKLIKKRGLANVPMLVCVGRNGWLNDAAFAKLEASEVLRKRVRMLSDISDAELSGLYRHCLFTVYPSSYEGWGLPVTEALCYGKLPLISDSSSLPEAGGAFAEYFEINSERDFQAKLERLFDDAAYRQEREAKIRSSFAPREWTAIADQIAMAGAGLARTLSAEADVGDGVWALPAKAGVFNAFTRNLETLVWRKMASGEVYRIGLGWNECDDWGCWMKASTADVAFRLEPGTVDKNTTLLVYLRIQGLPIGAGDVRVSVRSPDSDSDLLSAVVSPGQFRDLMFRLPPSLTSDGMVRLRLFSDSVFKLSQSSEGRDQRTATLGVCGFIFCAEHDVQTRLRIVEAVQFSGSLAALRPVPVESDIGILAQ